VHLLLQLLLDQLVQLLLIMDLKHLFILLNQIELDFTGVSASFEILFKLFNGTESGTHKATATGAAMANII
jgi:hypothetical protein